MPYTEQGLPFAPRSHTSFKAAESLAPKRAEKQARYLALITERPHSDHEAAAALRLPLSSICSIRNSLDEVVRCGVCESPYGKQVQRWGLAGSI